MIAAVRVVRRAFVAASAKPISAITSGTLFASHKLPLRAYLAAIAVFCNEVKGKSALAMSRDLGASYKASWVLLHKLREAMAEEMRGRVIGGDEHSPAFNALNLHHRCQRRATIHASHSANTTLSPAAHASVANVPCAPNRSNSTAPIQGAAAWARRLGIARRPINLA
jgi:hypothetical protein